MRLIRTILILTGAGVLMPAPPEDLSATAGMAETDSVSAIEMLSSATSAVSDMAGFCARQPGVCTTAAYVAGRLEAKAKYSVKLIYEWASDAGSAAAVPAGTLEADETDLLQTGSTEVALADDARSRGQSTLRLDDLLPAWRGPAQPRKKG